MRLQRRGERDAIDVREYRSIEQRRADENLLEFVHPTGQLPNDVAALGWKQRNALLQDNRLGGSFW